MLSIVCLCILLGIGHLLRSRVKFLRTLYLPSSIIAGVIGVIVLSSAKGLDITIPVEMTAGWRQMPGVLINVVFACLFLGVKIPSVKTLWKRAGMQLCYGQIVAWGQYVVGIAAVLFFIGYVWDVPTLFAGILPVGFEGGHGTAAGMGPVFVERGWAAGRDFALAAATGGVVSAIVVGMLLINIAVRRGWVARRTSIDDINEEGQVAILPVEQQPIAGRMTVSPDAIGALSFHLVIISVSILIGIGLKEFLVWIEQFIPFVRTHHLLGGFPLFPLCMIGGIAVQAIAEFMGKDAVIDEGLIRRIQNAALDFLVVAAIATIRLDVVAEGIIPLVLLIFIGIAWNVACVLFLAKRMFKVAWFERAIAEMGQSMGVTATGLLLLRVVDPEYETPAADAFACKQILHEPFMGGGLWTSTAIPLIAVLGGGSVLGIACAAVVVWLIIGFFLRRAQYS